MPIWNHIYTNKSIVTESLAKSFSQVLIIIRDIFASLVMGCDSQLCTQRWIKISLVASRWEILSASTANFNHPALRTQS